MPRKQKDEAGRGWHGNSKGHARAGKLGGERTASEYGSVFYAEIGRAGGKKRGKNSAKNKEQSTEQSNQRLEELEMDDLI